ncbi:MAG: EamA family transporter [Actinomycetota bacterium]
MSGLKTFFIWLLFAVAWALGVTLTFLTWNIAPPAAGVAVQFVSAAVILGLFYSRHTSRLLDELIKDWKEGRRKEPSLAIAMALSLGLGYLLMVVKRYSYAPSGSDVVFLLETIPIFVVVIAWLSKAEKPTLGMMAGSAAALLGGIAVVGNWERPSSFSPFSRLPFEETILVLSAALVAWFIVLLWRQAKTRPVADLTTLTVWLAVPVLLVAAIGFNGVRGFLAITPEGYAILAATGAIGVALPIFLLSKLAKRLPASTASSAIFLSPVIITLLIGVEQSVGGGFLPTPFLWVPIVVGCLISVTGVTAVWKG